MSSQAEEDQILAGLLTQLGYAADAVGTFVEIGVGVGIENNTLALAERGWKGLWIGNERLDVDPPMGIAFQHAQVELDNLHLLLLPATCTVFSIDIDGNDYWIARAVLQQFSAPPPIIIVEYNATWGDRHEIMPYARGYAWHTGQPFGASLTAWRWLLESYGYELVYCTQAQVNAFFVHHTAQRLQTGVDDGRQHTHVQQGQGDPA
jgi:hypothetical protein